MWGILFAGILIICAHQSSSLMVQDELKSFSCQDGWIGEMPKAYVEFMNECYKDKTTSIECRKHCMAKKLNIILDGKIWIFQLLEVLKTMFPSAAGRDTVDKMVDVILSCTDFYEKDHGPLVPYLCYREKHMWTCVSKAIQQICKNNKRRREPPKDRSKHPNNQIIVNTGKNGHSQVQTF